jgi:hypothetical protein
LGALRARVHFVQYGERTIARIADTALYLNFRAPAVWWLWDSFGIRRGLTSNGKE